MSRRGTGKGEFQVVRWRKLPRARKHETKQSRVPEPESRGPSWCLRRSQEIHCSPLRERRDQKHVETQSFPTLTRRATSKPSGSFWSQHKFERSGSILT